MANTTSEYVNIHVTSNQNTFSTERRFPSDISMQSLKGKLELLTGVNMNTMKLELRNKDEERINAMTDDSMTLGQYGVENGMIIYVIGTESFEETDESDVSFQLSEEEYAKREESARLFLMKNKLGKYDEEKLLKKKEEETKESALAEFISVGSRCEITTAGAPPRRGVIRFVGKVHFQSGDWVGVQYDEPVGKNDGQVGGKQYFECSPKYGGFVKPSNVKIGDFPEIGLDDLDEI